MTSLIIERPEYLDAVKFLETLGITNALPMYIYTVELALKENKINKHALRYAINKCYQTLEIPPNTRGEQLIRGKIKSTYEERKKKQRDAKEELEKNENVETLYKNIISDVNENIPKEKKIDTLLNYFTDKIEQINKAYQMPIVEETDQTKFIEEYFNKLQIV